MKNSTLHNVYVRDCMYALLNNIVIHISKVHAHIYKFVYIYINIYIYVYVYIKSNTFYPKHAKRLFILLSPFVYTRLMCILYPHKSCFSFATYLKPDISFYHGKHFSLFHLYNKYNTIFLFLFIINKLCLPSFDKCDLV